VCFSYSDSLKNLRLNFVGDSRFVLELRLALGLASSAIENWYVIGRTVPAHVLPYRQCSITWDSPLHQDYKLNHKVDQNYRVEKLCISMGYCGFWDLDTCKTKHASQN